jgi:hypothetical protein
MNSVSPDCRRRQSPGRCLRPSPHTIPTHTPHDHDRRPIPPDTHPNHRSTDNARRPCHADFDCPSHVEQMLVQGCPRHTGPDPLPGCLPPDPPQAHPGRVTIIITVTVPRGLQADREGLRQHDPALRARRGASFKSKFKLKTVLNTTTVLAPPSSEHTR